MIYNYTSSKCVISKILADNDTQENTKRIPDMIEWMGEAMEKIGAFPTLETHVTGKEGIPLLEVSNYQVQLPTGMHGIIQASYSPTGEAPFYPMRYATGSYDTKRGITTISDAAAYSSIQPDGINIIGQWDASTNTPDLSLLTLNNGEAYEVTVAGNTDLNDINNWELMNLAVWSDTHTGNWFKAGSRKERGGETAYDMDYTYVTTNNYMKLNVQDGYVLLAYTSIPIDSEGLPLIPDDISFQDALYWYVNMKLLYPKWVEGRVRDAVYYDARSSWNYYRKQAYGNAMMPNGDQLTSIKNTWNKLVPELREHNTWFSTIGEEQSIFNHNGKSYTHGTNNSFIQ